MNQLSDDLPTDGRAARFLRTPKPYIRFWLKKQELNHAATFKVTAQIPQAQSIGPSYRQVDKHTATGEEMSERLYEAKFNPSAETLRFVQTGIAVVDRKIGGGLHEGQFATLAASTGGGKSTFALNIAENAVIAGRTVLFVSLEMTELELAERIIARRVGLTIDQQRGDLSERQETEYKQGLAHVANLGDRLHVHTPPATTVGKIRAEARMIAARGSLDLICVDYLQLLTPEERHPNKNSAVAEITRALKVMASDLKVPVLALSQLNREGSTQVPELRHLRDSGSIEQDSNIVFFLHAPDESQSRNLIIAKNRNGPKDHFPLSYEGKRFLFEDPSSGSKFAG